VVPSSAPTPHNPARPAPPGAVEIDKGTPAAKSAAPGPVTGLNSSAVSSSQLTLSWTNPTTAGFAGVVIRRAVGAVPPATPTDGTAAGSTGAAATTFTDTGLTASTQYSYALFAHDAVPSYSAAATITVTTAAVAGVTAVTTTAITQTSLALKWTNPTSPDFASVVLRRATGGTAPNSPTAGTGVTLSSGTATSVTDTGLTVDTQYSYAFFTRDTVGTYSPAVTASFVTQCKPGVIHVSGAIAANTTWGPTCTYVVDSTVTVNASTTLTVMPRITVKFVVNQNLAVTGTLKVAAVSGAVATLTSIRDDSVAGDTNGDGVLTVPAPGDWSGVYVNAGGVVNLAWAKIAYGSYGVTNNGSVALGAITVGHSTIASTYYAPLQVTAGAASFTANANTITGNLSGSYDGVYANSITGIVTITGNTVTGVHRYGIEVVSPSAAPTITGNTVSSAAASIQLTSTTAVDPSKLAGNTVSNGFGLSADTITVSGSWSPGELLYLDGSVTITSGTTLTLPAGTIVKGNGSGQWLVSGTLVATGTSASAVTMTSWRDDSVGGDLNADGSQTTPAPNDWYGVYVNAGGNVNLAYTKIAYVSYGVTNNGGSALGAITLGNSTISSTYYAPVQATAGAASFTVDSVTITGDVANYDGIYANNVTGTVSITGSTVTGVHGFGIEVRSPAAAPTITGNTVSSASASVQVTSASALDPAKLSGNTLNLGVGLSSDTITTTGTWTAGQLIYLDGPVTIAAGTKLTLPAGTIVKGNGSGQWLVSGTLATAGVSGTPVTMTSWRDDTVGGDTNADGSQTSPAANDWYGVYVNAGGNVNLAYTTIEYVSYGVTNSGGSALGTITVTHSTISATYYGPIDITAGAASLTVTADTISGNVANYDGIYANHVTGAVSITGNTVSGVHYRGIEVVSPTAAPTITGNTVGSALVSIQVTSATAVDPTKLTGNTVNYGVGLSSDTITTSGTWPAGELLYLDGSVTIAAGVTLTLPAGTLVKGSSSGQWLVSGTLTATGTNASPVSMTSWRDDSIGGDTNADGSQTTPAAGDWYAVYVNAGGNVNLTYTRIYYGYYGVTNSGGSAVGAISVTHSTIASTYYYPLEAASGAASFTATADTITGNATDDGIYINNVTGTVSITGNTITGIRGHAVYIANSKLSFVNLVGNAGSGNVISGLYLLNDTVTGSSTYTPSGSLIPIVVGTLTINSGVTLTLAAGTVIKGDSSALISVAGSLVASGTGASHVVMTSLRDDTAGGDTNGDGATTVPAANDWQGVKLAGGSASLTNTDIRYASNPAP
jgi:hypothetical protein